MKAKTLFFSLLFLSSSVVLFSQEDLTKPAASYKKNQIGIQLNPYIDNLFFDFNFMNTVAAIRYGHRFTKNFTTGVEFSSYFPINIATGNNFYYFKYFSYRAGAYARYSIRSEKRLQLFAEASPFFSHYSRPWTTSSDHSPYSDSKFGYYVAPGITLYSKTRRISFDLYYKFSNQYFSNSNKSILSYKVNYNF